MSVTVNGTNGLTFSDSSTQNTSPFVGGLGFRNRIINGAMMIDQRNAGASVTATTTSALTYTLDRFFYYVSVASKFTIQQNAGSVTPPSGFSKYLGVTSSSSYSVGAGEIFNIGQAVEGLNMADLGWGTVNAQTVTLSFWVRSSLTGTFGGAVRNGSVNRSYPFTYTINSANTWEQKSVTIVGDTTGTWATNNTAGMYIQFSLGTGTTYSGTAGTWAAANYASATGATSIVGTNGATFYITGVQLEKGSTATSFDYRPYGTELALCQRYAVGYSSEPWTYALNGSAMYTYVRPLPVPMRTAPSIQSGASYSVSTGSAGTVSLNTATTNSISITNGSSNWTASAAVSFTGVLTSEL